MTRTAPPEADETPQAGSDAGASEALKVGTSNVRELFTRNLRQSGIYIAFVVIIVLFAILTDGLSLNPANITNIILQYSYVLILAIGMVIVIIAGHIDLSVGSVVALTGAASPRRWPGRLASDSARRASSLVGASKATSGTMPSAWIDLPLGVK